MTSVSPGDAAAAAGHAGQPGAQGFTSTSAEFFLQNYRLGKTLGIGSFGKVGSCGRPLFARCPAAAARQGDAARLWPASRCRPAHQTRCRSR